MVRILGVLLVVAALAGGAAAQPQTARADSAAGRSESTDQAASTGLTSASFSVEQLQGTGAGVRSADTAGAPAVDERWRRSAALREVVAPFPQGLPFYGSAFVIGERPGNQPDDTKDAIISEHYQVGPGDEVVIAVWGELSLNLRSTVSPEGFIDMPGGSRLYVNGVRFGDLRETVLFELRQSYASALTAEKLASGAVYLQVTLSGMRGIQVFMTGQVANPGVYQFPSSSVLLLSAISTAGGLSGRGSLRNIEIRRGTTAYRVDLYDLLLSGDIGLDAQYLRHQDVVHIPDRDRTVSIEGSVRRPAIYELKAGDTLADLLRLAGGLSYDANETRVQIKRTEKTRGVSLIDVDLTAAPAGSVALVDGDWVQVSAVPKRRREAYVQITGSGVRQPGTYAMSEVRTLAALIAKAGGLYEDALQDRVELVRINDDYSKAQQVLDLRSTRPEEYNLRPDDSFLVYSRYSMEGGDKYVSLTGHVKSPGRYLLPQDMTLYDLLFRYGGFADTDFRAQTYKDRATLIRTDPATGKRAIESINLLSVLNGTSDMQLRSEDEVRIYPEDQFRDRASVTLEGEVRRPGPYDLYQDMTLGDLLTQGGGLKPAAYASKVEVARLAPRQDLSLAERQTIRVDVVEQGDHFLLEEGDIVFVRRIPGMSEQEMVTIQGEVRFPGKYNLSSLNERLSEVVARAGGVTEAAFIEGAQLTRVWDGQPRPVALDMGAALRGHRDRDIILRPGDAVTIPSNNLVIEVKGEVQLPSLVQYEPGLNVADYVGLVGGYKDGAAKGATYIVRANGLIMSGHRRFLPDPEVPPGATIVVPGGAATRKASAYRRYGLYAVSAAAGVAAGILAQR